MKTLLALLITLSLFSCNTSNKSDKTSKVYHLKFVVFYPSENDTIEVSNTDGYSWYSQDGTNNIFDRGLTFDNKVYSNTAPYKIISYELEEVR